MFLVLAFDNVFQSHSPQPGDNSFGFLGRSIAKCIEYKARKANLLDCEKVKYRRLVLCFFKEVLLSYFVLFCTEISVNSIIQENETVEQLIHQSTYIWGSNMEI